MYVTLEPCHHQGKTPPCTDAVINAKIARCVIARPDPTPMAAGGAKALTSAGIAVEFIDAPRAARLTDSFVKRETTGLPWVLAKWASSVDGRIALPSGESRWISHPRSRCAAHRMRARMDAILTGIGTVHADDPLFTPRHVIHRRPNPKRLVVDPQLSIPLDCRLVKTTDQAPTLVATLPQSMEHHADRAANLRALGVTIISTPSDGEGELDLVQLFRTLVTDHAVTRLMVEAGGGLVGRLIAAGLVDEIMIYLAPRILGGGGPHSPTRSLNVQSMDGAPTLSLRRVRRIADDVELNYRFNNE
jgi:diaminohydroxyphosphoribosylaminopyrimidine deaminase/5-amino-6-(5-phosphoribosylamino)uracil reductase